MAEEKQEKQVIEIPMTVEVALNKDGTEMKDPGGNVSYKQEDFQGLMFMLSQYDSQKAGSFMKEGRTMLRVKDKVEKAWIAGEKKIKLTIEEAGFLQKYLNEFHKKPIKIPEYAMRTLFSVLDVLE